MQDVVSPTPNGWGVDPTWTMQEAYRFRLVGESFNGSPSHVQWVEKAGRFYRATWIDYQYEAEHVQGWVPHNNAGGYMAPRWGFNQWEPIGIKDIYGIAADNHRLKLYLPTPAGDPYVVGRLPGMSAG